MNKERLSLNSTTPKKVTSRIRKFLRTMQLHNEPIFLQFTYKSELYLPQYCLSNCEHLQKITGCKIVFGWMIWEDKKKRFIEAEFHAVVKQGSSLVDITPRIDGEKKILFVPDHKRIPKRKDESTWCTWSSFKSYRGRIEPSSSVNYRDLKPNVWSIT